MRAMTAAPPSASSVTIDAGPLSLTDLCAVARGAGLALGPAARARIADSRAVVEAAVDGPDLVYGLNTGLGHMRDVRVDRATLGLYQEVIVRSHVGAIGRTLPTEVVRAAMAVRINGFARGGSGISPAVADGLVAMLDAGIHPVIGETGSVGAADLMHMSAIAQVLIGTGRAELGGEILQGAEALRRADLAPVRLGPKDGLALISANGVSIGRGALVIDRATRLARAADVVFALTLEAVHGNPSIVEPIVARSKPVPGQLEAATRIRRFLTGSGRCEPGGASSVQDPLSFRVAPQVHGALRMFLDVARDAVELELNAADDNPVVDVDQGRLVSNGNFHPIAMALAFDALRPALAHVGQLADRRLDHHWRLVFAQEMTEELLVALADSGALLRYAAAARAGDLRSLATPATLDIGSLDLGQEDHSTNAPTTVARTDAALDALADVLATEVLSARWLIGLNQTVDLGVGTAAALQAVEGVLGGLPASATTEDRHSAVRDALDTIILDAAEGTLEPSIGR
jgi:histidine ammonia-lyase